MKKTILAVMLMLVAACFSEVSAQQKKFYYYPGSNVYYDVATSQYIYPNNGTWTSVKALPAGMTVRNKPRYMVYNDNAEVWQNNTMHVKKYKVAKTNNGNHKGWSKKGNHYGTTRTNVKAKTKVKSKM